MIMQADEKLRDLKNLRTKDSERKESRLIIRGSVVALLFVLQLLDAYIVRRIRIDKFNNIASSFFENN